MSKAERQKTIHFEYESAMRDVGHYRATLILKRKTANLVSNIKFAKAKMLGGLKAASPADDFHFEVMAALANAIEISPDPRPNEPGAWIEDILDPAIWYAIYQRWDEYQDSFSQPEGESASKNPV